MAIGITYKSRVASTTGATSYTCAPTWTPAAQSLAVAFVVTCLAATPLDPTTVTGHGVSYSKLTLSARTLSTTHAVSIWVAKMGASPTNVACVASYGAVTQTGGLIIEFEVTGHDNSGTALAAIIQNPTNTGTATSGNVTLAGAGGVNNRPMSFWLHLYNEATTPKASQNWVETSGADGNFTNPPTGGEAQHNVTSFDTAPTASWTNSSLWRGVAIEIKAALAAYSLNVDPGEYSVSGVASGVLADRLISTVPGSYGVTGINTTLSRGYSIPAESGGYLVAGVSASVLATRLLDANPGDYTVTGVLANILANRILNAESGSYLISGLDTLLSRGFILIALPGEYILTGFDAELLKETTGFFLLADPGTYGVAGSDTALLAARVLNAESGIYIASGVNAAIVADRILAADPGAYVVTGLEAITLAQRLLNANLGEYTITGLYAELLKTNTYSLLAEPGVYVIIGSATKVQLDNLDAFPSSERPSIIMVKNVGLVKKITDTFYLKL